MTEDARAILRHDGAAVLGVLGVFLLLLSAIGGLYVSALIHGTTFAAALPKNPGRLQFKIAAMLIALIGFALVRVKPSVGWTLALIGVSAIAVQPLYTGRFASKINAVHILAASTWLGTLVVLTLIGIRGVMRSNADAAERARIVADLVNAFSPLALIAAVTVVITGATTAWLHLKRISALFDTDYGHALIVKLLLVLIVIALGAWNWRRVRPSLGAEGTEHVIRRSATAELAFAGLVLVVTSILVTLPSPK